MEEDTGKEQQEQASGQGEKLPLDARLLSEAIIEFNISRRSVGLYPPGHSMITSSIERAFGLLQKLFEMRTSITLGVARNALAIDELLLDRRNPVYAECALSFHEKGIAGITFTAGLGKDELIKLHELLTKKDGPVGRDLVEEAERSSISHIRLMAIDYSAFRFVEGGVKETAGEGEIWEDYIYGMLTGRLTDEEAERVVDSVSPEQAASIINSVEGQSHEEVSYDRVITSYLRRKGESGLSPESTQKLLTLINSLNPNVKRQFLSRTFENISMDIPSVENLLKEMTSEGFAKLAHFFTEHNSMVPGTLRSLIDKFRSLKGGSSFNFDLLYRNTAVVDDIEIGEDIMGLFDEKSFQSYVSAEYQKDLDRMMARAKTATAMTEELEDGRMIEDIDRVASEVMIEVMESDIVTREDYLDMLTKLAASAKEFVDTGRFEEALNVYNTLYTDSLSGKFGLEARSSLTYFFKSEDFISGFVGSIFVWGRRKRQEVTRMARALKPEVINPLMDALMEEQDASNRRFLLHVLTDLGTDVVPEAVKHLKDKRWFVTRNMLYLIRECRSAPHIDYVRKYAKHPDRRISMEAVRGLLEFKTNDAVPYIKLYLNSADEDTREQAVRMAGAYQVREAVPILVEMLRKKDLLGGSLALKTSIVRALGDIGDERAVGALMDTYRSRTLLFKGSLQELKVEIFRNIDRYPLEAVRPLVELGLESKNEEIQSLCRQMAKSMGGEA